MTREGELEGGGGGGRGEDVPWQAVIQSHRLAMMQATDGAWRKNQQ